jgi:hypothetical protein
MTLAPRRAAEVAVPRTALPSELRSRASRTFLAFYICLRQGHLALPPARPIALPLSPAPATFKPGVRLLFRQRSESPKLSWPRAGVLSGPSPLRAKQTDRKAFLNNERETQRRNRHKAQGKSREMHDTLFENQTHLTRADLLGYAKSLGLDLAA